MAGPVTLTTPVGGTVISSSTFGIPTATNLGIALNRPWVTAYQGTAVTSIANAAFTAILFDTEDAGSPDPFGIHSTTTNTSRFTVPTGWAGVWHFEGVACFPANATGSRLYGVREERHADHRQPGWWVSDCLRGDDPPVLAVCTVLLAVGDDVELQASSLWVAR